MNSIIECDIIHLVIECKDMKCNMKKLIQSKISPGAGIWNLKIAVG